MERTVAVVGGGQLSPERSVPAERSEEPRGLGAHLLSGHLELSGIPVVSLWDGRVVGVEVLTRWHTPDGRVLPPVEFLPLVDDAGLWVDLDEAVLLAALGAGETLPEAVTIGVHLSADSLLRPDLGA